MDARRISNGLKRGMGVGSRRSGRARAPISESFEALESRQMMAADPVTTNNPVWFASYGTPTVDGFIRPGEWDDAIAVTKAQPNKADSSATLRMKYDEKGMYFAFDVRDAYLWNDGNGGGSGYFWEPTNDDSMALYFDPKNARVKNLGPAGRMLEVNTGRLAAPINGPGVVNRFRYLKGDGKGFGTPVNFGSVVTPGMRWRSRFQGTINNNSDVDQGYTTEIFLPWKVVNMPGMPQNGHAIGMNFMVYFDDDGGTRNWTSYEHDDDPALRFGPRTLDDQLFGVDSGLSTSNPGFQGPTNYAQLVFTDTRVGAKPVTIGDLSASNVSGYGARLNFTAPMASDVINPLPVRGGVHAYDIRLSSSPIVTEQDWANATPVSNKFVPKNAGQKESLRFGGLSPSTTYYVAVRAVDAAGRDGDMATTSFTTQSTIQDPSNGERVIPSPDGGHLITEAGTPFIMVASTAVMTDRYVRNLYPGDLWASAGKKLINFSEKPGPEGDARGYFEELAANGVNTLRVPLEWLALEQAGRGQLPRGMAWVEYPAGNFNPALRQYLWNMMTEAERVGIKLILHPFATFNYKQYFELTPWAKVNGGPLDTIDNFFQNPTVLQMAANRIKTTMDWVNQGPSPETVIGIELINEWDDWTWTLNPRGNGDSSRTLEKQDRSKFMVALSSMVRQHDADFNIVSSSIGLVPRGPSARAFFMSDAFDVLAPHYYSVSTSEPINSLDADKSIRPITDYGALAAYWLTSRRDNRPIHNGEWGLVKWLWPNGKSYYTGISPVTDPSKPWTVENDVAMYRTTTWTMIAAGMAGTGNRLGGLEMRDLVPSDLSVDKYGYLPLPLPLGMRKIQSSVSDFVSDTRTAIDWAKYDATTLAGHIRFGNVANRRLIGIGSTTGVQGLVYVAQDLNKSSASVNGATMAIDGLRASANFGMKFEVWSTGADADVLATITSTVDANGRVLVTLPTFNRDVMIKFDRVDG
jgi:hypothetical protein